MILSRYQRLFSTLLFSVSLSACGSDASPTPEWLGDSPVAGESWVVAANSGTTPVRSAVPSVAERIRSMPAGTGLLLPVPTVVALDADLSKGPPPRDYSNRMVYSSERQTALYLGGGHNNHRRNDVWEYHLATNTWQQLFPSDGGSHKVLNTLLHQVIWKRKEIEANGYSSKQQQVIKATREWWESNAVLNNGRITTTYGGPLLPFHTWDAVVFDESVGKLLWAVGGSWLPTGIAQSMVMGESLESVRSQLSSNFSNMWTFDPSSQQYGQLEKVPGGPSLRGMGASMVYVADRQKTLYYVAASNVTPNDFGMYWYDARANSWQELRPNGGASIKDLAFVQKESPQAEAQMAYSEKHQLILAVLKNDSFIYDLNANHWERLPVDDRIYGHDARSVPVYDKASGVFLLANPTNELQTISFNVNTNELTISEGNTINIPAGQADADADPENELQDLQLNGTTLSIDGGNQVDLAAIQDGTEDADADPNNELQTIQFDANNNKLNLKHSITISEKEICHTSTDKTEFHSIANINDGKSVSLHLYKDPIKKCRVYCSESGEMIQRNMKYDFKDEAVFL